jgi:hypothetical protein
MYGSVREQDEASSVGIARNYFVAAQIQQGLTRSRDGAFPKCNEMVVPYLETELKPGKLSLDARISHLWLFVGNQNFGFVHTSL